MPVYVRVKRLTSQAPIGFFRAERSFKRSGRNAHSTNFRYIGTQLSQFDSVDVNIKTSKEVLQKQCTLLWNSAQTAILRQSGLDPVPCLVSVKTLKRSADSESKSPSTLDDYSSPPCKLLRIMDILPNEDKVQLSDNLETLTLVEDPITASKSPSLEQAQIKNPNFVYDVYEEEAEKEQSGELQYNTDTDHKLIKLGYKIHGDDYFTVKESNFWYDNEDSEQNEIAELCDDEDDSNSESNWRNDYPDEDDFPSSSDHSSSSNEDRSDETEDDDDDNYNYGYH